MLIAGGREHVALHDLLENELATYTDENNDRVSLAEPDVVLGAQPVMAIGTALLELTINAVKHGALCSRGAKMEVVWKRIADGLTFEWLDRDVYPRRTQVVRRLLPHQLGARGDVNVDPDRLKAKIEITLA